MPTGRVIVYANTHLSKDLQSFNLTVASRPIDFALIEIEVRDYFKNKAAKITNQSLKFSDKVRGIIHSFIGTSYIEEFVLENGEYYSFF